ncbi:MAG: hypothetical protein QOC72_926 [Methylobacteriaceae bacterium]|jgi:hypothetical protein|nr:hypothetical protein [Methylobacteriaceae bacterium]
MKKPKPLTQHADTQLIEYYAEPLPLADFLPINVGLSSARVHTMISILGSPKLPLTTHDQPGRASDLVKKLRSSPKLTDNIKPTGIRPALESLASVLHAVFATAPDLEQVLDDNGMLVVRNKRPTDGSVSKEISNHSWGTAIDFRLIGGESPANTHSQIPRYISLMLPHFNEAGWYSGIAFHDTMHFEVADETMHQWADEGRFAAP